MFHLILAHEIKVMGRVVVIERVVVRKWKEAFERKGLKANLGKTKVIVREHIT